MTKNSASADAGFRALLDAAPDAMVISDQRGHIVSVNGQAERLFGYKREELIGRAVEMLVPSRYRTAHIPQREAYANDPRARPMGANLDLYALRQDGSEFPVEISLSPLALGNERLVVSAIRDITDRRAAEAERNRLIQERAAQAEANRVKDQFLATLSHELRTPLNAILGWTRLARMKSPDPEVERALATIDRNARMQAQLIEDLLDVSRVLAGKLRLEMGTLDLTDVCDAAVEVVRPAAQAKELQLHISYETKPLLMVGDADRLQQVVWNLLSNAVKFTASSGRVELTVHRTEDGMMRVAVKDTGKGIRSEFLPHVFDRFRQADSSVTRQYGGLGLGLSIARSLVESHGGTIEVASSGEGRGATFVVTLPSRSAATPRLNGGDAVHEDLLHGVRLLVVDDQRDERELLSEILSLHGAEVRTAGSASEAMDILPHFAPHVLLSDIAMPGEDGHALMRRVRQMEGQLATTPALAVTAHARSEDRSEAFAAGFQDYVEKPLEMHSLVQRVARLVSSDRPAKVRPFLD